MIGDILKTAKIPAARGRYLNPPPETYAVYFDNQATTDGPDPQVGAPLIVRHDCMVELYEPKKDSAAEAALEKQLTARGLCWIKQDRYWLSNVQRYETVYNFYYYEKRRA